MYKDSVSRDQTCDFKHEYMLHTCNTATFFFCETLNSFFLQLLQISITVLATTNRKHSIEFH